MYAVGMGRSRRPSVAAVVVLLARWPPSRCWCCAERRHLHSSSSSKVSSRGRFVARPARVVVQQFNRGVTTVIYRPSGGTSDIRQPMESTLYRSRPLESRPTRRERARAPAAGSECAERQGDRHTVGLEGPSLRFAPRRRTRAAAVRMCTPRLRRSSGLELAAHSCALGIPE